MFQFGRLRSSSIATSIRCSGTMLLNRNITRCCLRTPPSSPVTACKFSTATTTTPTSFVTKEWLESDTGKIGTQIYHTLTILLAVGTPVYFVMTPQRYIDGYIHRTFGTLFALGITLHTQIGLNYVCRDYVPKLSSKLLGPARIVTLGLSFIIGCGLSKIALFSPGGLKGIVTGLWTSSSKSSVVLTDTNKNKTEIVVPEK